MYAQADFFSFQDKAVNPQGLAAFSVAGSVLTIRSRHDTVMSNREARMNRTCVTCKYTGPESELVKVEGKWMCRDVIGCDYRNRPWKNPYLSDEERKRAREEYVASLRQATGE